MPTSSAAQPLQPATERGTPRTAVVTGASGALGLACADALLAADGDWRVVLAVRDVRRGREALMRLPAPERCAAIALDLASLDSVRSLPGRVDRAGFPPLRALVCNAGLQMTNPAHCSVDGFELTFAVNHLGHFALVQALRDRLAPPARIVVVSSDTHDPRRSTGMPAPRYTSAAALARPASSHGSSEGVSRSSAWLGRQRYTTSKLCNVLFAYELDRRLGEGSQGIAVNAFNPGLMPGSGLARDYGTLQRAAWRFLMPALRVLPQVRGTRQSGRDLAALAADRTYEGVTGRYFDGSKPTDSSEDSYDRNKARDLWETSERLLAEALGEGHVRG